MARPKAESKRKALLQAAVLAISEFGLGASTAKISKLAGVAEGTLYTYFKNKKDLFNELYLELKINMRDVLINEIQMNEDPKIYTHALWLSHIKWGENYPLERKVLGELNSSKQIKQETKIKAIDAFYEFNSVIDSLGERGLLRQYPPFFLITTIGAIVEATMEFIDSDPEQSDIYSEAGFSACWGAISV